MARMCDVKATLWSVTAFNSEIELLEAKEFPDYVKKVYGGREVCPETGTLHFQGMIKCLHQVRLSKLKKWLPTAHLEIARDGDALEKYVMKSETAVGPKRIVENDNSAHGFAFAIAKEIVNEVTWKWDEELCEAVESEDWRHWTEKEWIPWFDKARFYMLKRAPASFFKFQNLPFRKLWCETAVVWIEAVLESRENLVVPTPERSEGENNVSDSQSVSQTPG